MMGWLVWGLQLQPELSMTYSEKAGMAGGMLTLPRKLLTITITTSVLVLLLEATHEQHRNINSTYTTTNSKQHRTKNQGSIHNTKQQDNRRYTQTRNNKANTSRQQNTKNTNNEHTTQQNYKKHAHDSLSFVGLAAKQLLVIIAEFVEKRKLQYDHCAQSSRSVCHCRFHLQWCASAS